MTERLEYVDIAKGFALLLVIWSHSDALNLMWLMMDMCIPIFFFCSGYTYTKRGSFGSSMAKRFRKLFVPYLFFNVVLFCVFRHLSFRELLGVLYSRYSLYPLDITPNIKFLTSGNYPMWFLTGMVMSSFLFYIIVYQEKYKHMLITFYALLTVAFMNIPILLPWSIDTAPLIALIMYAGMEARQRRIIMMNFWFVLFLVLMYLGLRHVGGDLNISVRMYGTSVAIYFILAILAPIIVLWGAKYLQGTFAGKFFLILGKNSLIIFCIEIPFIVWAKDIYEWLFPGDVQNYLKGLFEIVVALLGGLMVSVLIRKSNFLSRIVYAS